MRIFVSYRRISRCGAVTVTAHDLNGSRLGEYDGDTGVLLREYLWLGGMPLAVLEGGQLYHLHADHIGRPVMATDSFGAVVWQATYTPFGGIHQVTPNTGALTAQDLRFPGQWFQAETGLHQNWMRDYDPTTGRYLQADPLGLVDGPSVYGYARQSPTRYTDPRGEQTGICIIAPWACRPDQLPPSAPDITDWPPKEESAPPRGGSCGAIPGLPGGITGGNGGIPLPGIPVPSDQACENCSASDDAHCDKQYDGDMLYCGTRYQACGHLY